MKEPSTEHAQAHVETEADNEHDAKRKEAHEHGRKSFLKLLWLTITGKEVEQDG